MIALHIVWKPAFVLHSPPSLVAFGGTQRSDAGRVRADADRAASTHGSARVGARCAIHALADSDFDAAADLDTDLDTDLDADTPADLNADTAADLNPDAATHNNTYDAAAGPEGGCG